MDRGELLENIKSLENLAKDVNQKDLFKDFLNSYNELVVKLCQITNNWGFNNDNYPYELNAQPFAKELSKIFSKSQAMTGIGAAIGVWFKDGTIKDFKEDINKIQKERHRVDTLLKIKKTNNNFETEYKNLKQISDLNQDSIGKKLYSLRNKLVHSFYSIENRSDLSNLIAETELLLIDLLLQKPINMHEYIKEQAYFLSLQNPNNTESDNWFLAKKKCDPLK